MSRLFTIVWCIGTCLLICSHVRADVPFDGNGDADVDFEDFVLFSGCHSGPDIAPLALCQEPFDFEFDADLDMHDFAAFQLCFSGENQPKLADCAGHQARIEEGCLHIIGTVADSSLALRLRTGVPAILEVDVGINGTADFAFDRGLFDCIVVSARGGDDFVLIDEANGIFTDTGATLINGGRGNDTLQGGSGGETFIGGDGDDVIFMGAGNDRAIWNPGDDTDIVEGDIGIDTVEVNGGNGAESFTVTANGARVRFDRVSPSPFSLDINACENIVLNANGGNDSLACTGNLAALIQITADGGAGDDILLGSNGADLLLGGDNNDFIDGQQGNDVVFGGAGDDTIQWDPGDGSDTIEGQGGHDIVLFNGSNAGEIFEFSANGSRLRMTRNVGNVVLDIGGVEQFDLNALGSTDTILVNSLAGTDVGEVNIDLAGTLDGASGDAQADAIAVNGTSFSDTIHVAAVANGVEVTGLSSVVRISHSEAANDTLIVNGLEGVDAITNGPGVGALIGLTMNP